MSNWCLGCKREIRDGDLCPACKLQSQDWWEEDEHQDLLMCPPSSTKSIPSFTEEEIEDLDIPF